MTKRKNDVNKKQNGSKQNTIEDATAKVKLTTALVELCDTIASLFES